MSRYTSISSPDEQGIGTSPTYDISDRQHHDADWAGHDATMHNPSPVNEHWSYVPVDPTPLSQSLATSNTPGRKGQTYSNNGLDYSYPHETVHVSSQPYDPYEMSNWNQGANQQVPPPLLPRPGKTRHRIFRLWTWEIMASLFSLGCMAAVVVVLIYEQGKPLDQWNRGIGRNISPSAVVSFLGTLGRSACMLALTEAISQLKWMHFNSRSHRLSDLELFDDASRGPWGALVLIISKNKSTVLASCASVLVLLSLLMDPFMQLIFNFPSKLSTMSTLPDPLFTSQVYDPQALPSRFEQCYSTTAVESRMQAAILAPVWNSTRDPQMPCYSERCDWPTITTLGVCSECTDLTDTVTSNCTGDVERRLLECTYHIEGIEETIDAQFGMTGGASEAIDYNTVWNSTNLVSDGDGELSKGTLASLVNFTYISFPKGVNWEEYIDSKTLKAKGNSPKVSKAMKCSFNFCARTLEKPSAEQLKGGTLSGPSTPLNWSSIPESTSAIEMLTMTPATSDHPTMNTTFSINYCNFLGLAQYLNGLFTVGSWTEGMYSLDGRRTPDIGTPMAEAGDVPSLLSEMAFSMTDVIRTTNSTLVHGTQKETLTFISISWGWLALPVTVVVLAFVMLILVMVLNRAQGVPAWRSSSLALLFHDVQGSDSSAKEGLYDPKQLEAEASRINARVLSTEGSLSFVRQ